MASTISRRQRRQSRAQPPRVHRTLRASAQKQKLDNKKTLAAQWSRRQEWQDEAWAYFNDVPEIQYVVTYQGNVMAKARWFVGWRNPKDPEADPIPVTDPAAKVDPALAAAAVAELERLRGPLGGLSEIVRELNMNLSIAGEAYLVGFGEREEAVDGFASIVHPEEWDIKSVSEVDLTGDTVKIKASPNDNKPRELDHDRDTIIRIWQRHPQFSMQAISNLRGVLGECEALVILSNLVKAEANSRMSAGILLIPNELGQGPDVPTEGEVGDEAANDPLMQEIYDGLTEPVLDPSSAAAVVPTMVRGNSEHLGPDVFRHISFSRDSSKDIEARIEARVLRITRGLDSPIEVALGHMNTTFTNAVQIEEDNYTKHFQPKLMLCGDAFTVGFLHPQLLDPDDKGEQRFQEDAVSELCVWFDPVDMVKQSDPLETATEGVNLGAISLDAWRRFKGYGDDDAPTIDELVVRAILGSPQFVQGLDPASVVGMLDAPLSIEAPPLAASAEVVQRLGQLIRAHRNGHSPVLTASRAKNGTRNLGETLMLIDRDLRSKLHVAANAAINRVLERAGNRLRNKAGPSPQLRALLKDVDAAHVGVTLGRQLVAAAGIADDDLIPASAWDELEEQFMSWGANAQARALKVVKKIVGLTDEAAEALAPRQFENLRSGWQWMKDALHDLAVAKIYSPDPLAPDLGEFDPTARVPTGLVRQAVARAGGASSLVTVQGDNPYVVVNNGQPPGGIATGELVMAQLSDAGVLVEGYEWVYGPAYRLHPFEPHEALDGEVFTDFESDVLLSDGEFADHYFPGDHAGDLCDVAPVLILPEDLEE